MKIDTGVNRRIVAEKKTNADRSGIGTKIIGIAHSLSTVGNRTSSCPLLETALSAMVMIGMIELIGSIRMMIGGLTSRLGEELQFMIGWGAGSVYRIDLVTASGIFPGTKKNLRRWQMHEFPMNSYFAQMPILIEWSQEKFVGNR